MYLFAYEYDHVLDIQLLLLFLKPDQHSLVSNLWGNLVDSLMHIPTPCNVVTKQCNVANPFKVLLSAYDADADAF